MMPRAICLEDDASPVDLAGAYLPLKGRRRLSVFSAGVSVHSGTPSGSCCSSDRVDLPLPGCRPDFLEKPGLLWSVMEQRLPSQSLQDFCLLCRSLPRLTNPSPVLRRACVALQGVLPPGSLVLGPHRKLRLRSPPARRGHLLIQAPVASVVGLAAFLGVSPCPSQPSLWNVSGLTGDRPHRTSLFDIFLVWLLPDCSCSSPFPILAASFSRAWLGAVCGRW